MWAFDLDLSVAFLVLWLRTALQKSPFYLFLCYVLVNDTRRIVGSSSVKIERVSVWFFLIMLFMILNDEFFIFCACWLDYDDNSIYIFECFVCFISHHFPCNFSISHILSFPWHFFNKSKNYIKSSFKFRYKPAMKITW